MEIRLKVIGGKNDGKEIPISVPEFIIGRGETANLRPVSDLVSRAHCSVSSNGGKAVLTDLNSRNGTFLNGNKVTGAVEIRPGDRLRVGRLVFEILIDIGQPSIKKSKLDGVSDAVARAAAQENGEQWSDDSVSGWLTDVEDERNQIDETRQFSLEEFGVDSSKTGSETISNVDKSGETVIGNKQEKEKKKVEHGKLPSKPKSLTDNSKDAASQVLQQFFNRR